MHILLYILNEENYKKTIRRNKFKFISRVFVRQILPAVVDEIVKDGEILAKVAGVNLKRIEISDEAQMRKFIQGIEKIKPDDADKIFIEEFENKPIEIIRNIEEETGLKFSLGRNTKISNIYNLINEIYNTLNVDNNSTDTLIITDDKELLMDVIADLQDYINFFSVIGMDVNIRDEVYDQVLTHSGISIFQPESIGKILSNYGTIINFNDRLDIDVNRIRNNAVILDFSQNKSFKVLEKNKKNVIYIEDIGFKMEINNIGTDGIISSALWEALGMDEKNKCSHIYTRGGYYTISEFVENKHIKKGKL